MKQFFYVLLLIASAGTGFLLVKGCQMFEDWRNSGGFAHNGGHLVTGVGDAPGFRGFTLEMPPADAPRLFSQWRELFATTVGIEYSSAWNRAALVAVTKAAHERGLAVVLLPPAAFSAANPYARPLPEIAADAQAAKVDRLCISWLNVEPDPGYWRGEAAKVRAAYGGKIILAATQEVLPSVTCWDASDFVGVAGPIALPKRLPHASDAVDEHDFRVAWDCVLTEFSGIGTVNDKKPVALLNVAVPRAVSFKLPPPGFAPAKMPGNMALQSMVYEALLLETKGRADFIDVMLLPWSLGDGVDVPEQAAVNGVANLLPKITEAWDPKKPKAAAPPEIPDVPAEGDPPEAGAGDGAAPTQETAPAQ